MTGTARRNIGRWPVRARQTAAIAVIATAATTDHANHVAQALNSEHSAPTQSGLLAADPVNTPNPAAIASRMKARHTVNHRMTALAAAATGIREY